MADGSFRFFPLCRPIHRQLLPIDAHFCGLPLMGNVSIEFRSNDTAKLRPIPDVYASDNLTSPV